MFSSKNFPENILSWQKLTETFGELLWMESEHGRLIAIGSTQFIEGEDKIFRPARKFDMKKVIQEVDDRTENNFELDNNQFQLSDMTSILSATIKEQKEEMKRMKDEIQRLKQQKLMKEVAIEKKEIEKHYEELKVTQIEQYTVMTKRTVEIKTPMERKEEKLRVEKEIHYVERRIIIEKRSDDRYRCIHCSRKESSRKQWDKNRERTIHKRDQ